MNGEAYHGSVFELKGVSSLHGYWLYSTWFVSKKNLWEKNKSEVGLINKLGGWGGQDGMRPRSVRWDGASAQAAARQALEDAHGDVHEGPEIEEQVVESVDRQSASLICIL